MRILVTGGAGFIGSHLCRSLVEQGHRVVAYDSLYPQAHEHRDRATTFPQDTGAELIVGDVRDADGLCRAVKSVNPEIVFHFAAETGTGQSFDEPTRYNAVNVLGTTHLIDALRREGAALRRIILAGSRSVYGEGAGITAGQTILAAVPRSMRDMQRGIFTTKSTQGDALTPVAMCAEKCAVAPSSVYASTKLMQEYLLTQAFWGSGVSVDVLRLQNVYGPGQSMSNPYSGILSIFAKQILHGHRLNVFEDGDITRDFVFVDDVVRAFCYLIRPNVAKVGTLDIGSGCGQTILDVAQRLIGLLGNEQSEFHISGDFRAGDIRHAVADVSLANRALDWTPQVPLEDGLLRFSEWVKSA